ncbi:DUF4129 domain-containing protein [Agromyces sp. ISL-38]|uniref:DUF4129 domain-containing protein n=1 Tax=Agromyces sp. ISL-38 TaxID=2819107 RepID=UPI001BEAC6BF|nr:DUF4129 domain-containing protein [Agromyces sp. ISL-38]MBT2500272.1 DUF4129 domain-containing protein [Agromyces sp. ISL-38]
MVLTSLGATPLDPDAPEARRWLVDELAKAEYRNAEPNAFDRAMQAIGDWFASLFEGAGGLPAPILTLLLVLFVAVLLVVGVLVFGVPRLRQRRRTLAPLFDDYRDLAMLHRAAIAAAAAGDWPRAIEERFRAIVRGIVERDLVRVHPGTTARGFTDAAALPFPDHAAALHSAAAEFDGVRYLGRAGSQDAYERLTALEHDLSTSAPAGSWAEAEEASR